MICKWCHSDRQRYAVGKRFCGDCGKGSYIDDPIVCKCCIPYVDTTEYKFAGGKRDTLHMHVGGFEIPDDFEPRKGFCPWDPTTFTHCLECNQITCNRDIYNGKICKGCNRKYACKNCPGNTYGAPEENITAKLCLDCAKFFTCIKCSARKHYPRPCVQCYECSTDCSVCPECTTSFKYLSLAFPWNRCMEENDCNFSRKCLKCAKGALILRDTVIQMLQPGRMALLFNQVRNLLTGSIANFESAVVIYLVLRWQNEETFAMYSTRVNVMSRVRMYDRLFRNYINSADAMRIKISEAFDCPYTAIFYMRWLPFELILKIVEFMDVKYPSRNDDCSLYKPSAPMDYKKYPPIYIDFKLYPERYQPSGF
jgi:hypothetical protein